MKSISTKLLVITLAIAAVGMALVAVISTVMAGQNILNAALGKIDESTVRASVQIDKWLTEQSAYVEAVATDLATEPNVDAESIKPSMIAHAGNNEDVFCFYVGYADNTAVFSDNWEPDYSEWVATERDWYTSAVAANGKVFITDPYVDSDTQKMCITISKTFSRDGKIAGVVAADIFIDTLQSTVSQLSVGEGSFACLTQADGTEITKGVEKKADLYVTDATVGSTGWRLFTAIPKSVIWQPIYGQITASAIVFFSVLMFAAALIYFNVRNVIVRPIREVTNAALRLAEGETDIRFDGKYSGEIGLLVNSFKTMDNSTSEQSRILESIANGDLSIDLDLRGEKDRMGAAIGDMLVNLNKMFGEINSATVQVSGGSRQIAEGAQTLAQGSTQQAAAIEELSSSISEIAQKTKDNAAQANTAAQLAREVRAGAERGSAQMTEMIGAVKDINDASNSIQKVIKVIDDIAFQTNILALNAAVEAARAGLHGKGFAVVAEEVRSLAAKSQAAAADTSNLIVNSMEKAELGAKIAAETAESLAEIVSGINRTTDIVSEIAVSSEESSSAIRQINTGIDQVAQVVQQNSATSEESAATSEELSGQSRMLDDLVAQFKLREYEEYSETPKKTRRVLSQLS